MKRKIRILKREPDSNLMGDLASTVAEFFDDYVVIGRVKDGLVWRFSDRTFATGAMNRLRDRLNNDDRMALEEMRDDHGN